MSGANSRRIYPDARRALLILSGAFASSVEWSYAFADNWLVTTGISARETYTTNVDLSPSDQARGDFVTELTPRIGISGAGARVKLSGTLSATGVAYAHESQKDQVLPQVNLLGNVEALEKLFYVEGSVTASQSYISPLGTQQPTNVNINQNRYTYIQYRLSPYIQTTLPSSTTLLVRSDNSWTNATQTSFALAKSYDNHSIARLDHAPTPWGWTAEFDRHDLKYSDKPSLDQPLVAG